MHNMSNILVMLQLFHNNSDVGTVDGCFVDNWVPKNLFNFIFNMSSGSGRKCHNGNINK